MKHRTDQKPKHITNSNNKLKKTIILQQKRNKTQKTKIQRKVNNIKSTTNHCPAEKKNSNSQKEPLKKKQKKPH